MAQINSKLLNGVKDVKIKITYPSTNPVIAGYEYQLKASNANAPIDDEEGDNQNSENDIYSLPSPITDNVGRYVLLTSKVGALDKDSSFTVQIDVVQDGNVTDTLKSPGQVTATGNSVLKCDMINFI